MEIRHKNLVFDFKYVVVDEELEFGGALITAENDVFKKFVVDLNWTDIREIDITHQNDELDHFVLSHFPEDQDDLDEKIKLEITYTDLMIVFFHWAMQQDFEIKISYEGDTPMWLFHDLIHAENDCYSTTILVDAFREEVAVLESIELANELGFINCINANMINRFDSEFKIRFNQRFPVNRALTLLNEYSLKKAV